MARYAILKSFYASEKWLNFRMFIISERMNAALKAGLKGLKCEHCGQVILDVRGVTLHHHPIELTPDNVKDPMVALNPKNVMVVHHGCHNQIHGRFGHEPRRQVHLVFGPPLSGKTTFAADSMKPGDIIVDMDRLFHAITMLPPYDKPNNLLPNVLAVQKTLIDNIKTRYGKWHNAWIVGGYADKYKRERLADELGAEIIFCDISKEECLRRLEMDADRSNFKAEWRKYIDDWFEKYVP